MPNLVSVNEESRHNVFAIDLPIYFQSEKKKKSVLYNLSMVAVYPLAMKTGLIGSQGSGRARVRNSQTARKMCGSIDFLP